MPKFQLLSFGRLGMRAFLRWVMTTAMIYVQVLLVLIQVHAQMKEQGPWVMMHKKNKYAPAFDGNIIDQGRSCLNKIKIQAKI